MPSIMIRRWKSGKEEIRLYDQDLLISDAIFLTIIKVTEEELIKIFESEESKENYIRNKLCVYGYV